MNEYAILSNLTKSDAVTQEQYEKAVRVLSEIRGRRSAVDWEANMDSLLEDSRSIMQERLLHELSFWIEMIVTGMSGADKVVFSLRKEFGEHWYKEWKNLAQDMEQKQLYAAGLAYEIVFGDINVSDFM